MHMRNKIMSETTTSMLKDNASKVTEISQIETEKDLGVIFDKNLTFSDHIQSKVNLANINLGLIFKTFFIYGQGDVQNT